MARKPSQLTTDIRKILEDSTGKMTHGKVRPLLVKLGHSVAKSPQPVSEDLDRLLAQKFEPDEVQDVINRLWSDSNVRRKVLREFRVRRRFLDERNNFDVTKYNWNKARKQRRLSRSEKPASKKLDDFLLFIKKLGGISKVESKVKTLQEKVTRYIDEITVRENQISEMQSQIAAMETALDNVKKLKAQIQDAA